ncbi:MAG: cytochrome c [Flavobacteriales bacterium]|nr:cytochrome c [Flavobacteriales bacterium]
MKKFLKVLKYIAIILVVLITGLICYVKFTLPNVGPPEDIKVEASPERIERGRYLANSVTVCMDCHSTRDWNKFSGPLVPGTLGKGGEEFSQKFGFPGKFFAKNITPKGIGDWTDGELLRAISSGVTKSGEAIFPVMPHAAYGKMDREDLYSIIAYIRTLDPIESEIPASEPDFPMNFIINTIPKKAEFSTRPAETDKLAYGKYLFTSAACGDCHTRQEKGTPVAGMELAGGFEFPMFTGGIVRSANITPDEETGIGKWTEDMFVARFKMYSDSTYVPHTIGKNEFNTVMPWTMYGHMKEQDLRAIFAYLQTVKPIKNEVVKFSK